MEIAEVKKVKLNVTNIKSVLIRSNKKLRNVEKKKSYLTRRQEEQEKRILLEKKIETPRKKLKIPLLGKAVGVVRSVWDRIVNFFGWLLAGFIVTRLPQIIENLKRRFAFIKPIWEGAMKTFAIIGKGMSALFRGMTTLYNLRRSLSNLDKSAADLRNLDEELRGMKRELGGNGSETGEESSTSTQQNGEDNVSDGSSDNNMGNMNESKIDNPKDASIMVENLKKENRKITTKGKRFKENQTRERINPTSKPLDRNIRVKRRTAKVVLDQKGPLEKDTPQAQTNTDIIVKNRFSFLNPFNWFGQSKTTRNPGPSSSFSGNGGNRPPSN
tara:strand:+ start:522 stop:1505 length:984 start_codon:yes stop_codon:yes gene_type:complete